jgi:acylphosphatase
VKSVRIKIYGVVQGVFFRKHTRSKAIELGINGWTRNAEDGTVEIAAEASPETLADFVSWCHRGPERAVVNKVEVTESPFENFTSFEIRR